MTTKESKLLSVFEKHIGHSSDLFDNEEWAEFDAFVAGVDHALEDIVLAVNHWSMATIHKEDILKFLNK